MNLGQKRDVSEAEDSPAHGGSQESMKGALEAGGPASGNTSGNTSGLHATAHASSCLDQTLSPERTQAYAWGLEKRMNSPITPVALV